MGEARRKPSSWETFGEFRPSGVLLDESHVAQPQHLQITVITWDSEHEHVYISAVILNLL